MGLYCDDVGLVVAYQFWPGLPNPGVLTDWDRYHPDAFGYVWEAIAGEYVRVYPLDWVVRIPGTDWLQVVPDFIFRDMYLFVDRA